MTRTRPRRTWGIGTAAALSIALALSACSGVASGDTVTLTVSHGLSAEHPASQAFTTFTDDVTERTGGDVEFEHTYEGGVCTVNEGLDCVSNGTVDIALMATVDSPELSLINVSSLPFQATDLQAATDAHVQLQAEDPDFEEELQSRSARALLYAPGAPPVIALKDPIESFDDLSGLSLRAGGSMATVVEAFGGNPVTIGAAETYESIERGVVSGAVLAFDTIVDMRLHEVAPYVYDIGAYVGLYAMTSYMMNEESWDRLSSEAQEVMSETATEVSASIIDEHFLPSWAAACEQAKEGGAAIEKVEETPSLRTWVNDGLQDQHNLWLANASSLDNPDEALRAYVERYDELKGEPTPPAHETCS
ncbi:TRAP transporter substrate-binding protein DctP [Aeromicrobium sp. CF4.19]|uniref:TRAP transporter substrate-binding protein DctP n=1 Tax=Aeromicrobium sp. CF4.19 TaxID=3373082 RepID=UPI003EE58055